MHISEELVRELQKRIDVTYEEAEYFLKRTKGDINMAVFLIMKKRNSSWEKFKASLWELMKYRFILTRKGETIINLPLLLLALFILLYGIERHIFPLIVIFITILITECEVRIEKLDWPDRTCKKRSNNYSGEKKEPSETYKYYEEQPKQQYKQEQEIKQELKKAPYQAKTNSGQEMTKENKEQPVYETKQKLKKDMIQQTPENEKQQSSELIQKPTNNLNEVEDDYYEVVIEE